MKGLGYGLHRKAQDGYAHIFAHRFQQKDGLTKFVLATVLRRDS